MPRIINIPKLGAWCLRKLVFSDVSTGFTSKKMFLDQKEWKVHTTKVQYSVSICLNNYVRDSFKNVKIIKIGCRLILGCFKIQIIV